MNEQTISRWGWMMDWCAKNKLAPADNTAWESAEQAYAKHQAEQTSPERLTLIAQIERCAENGKVAIIESGRDCDGVSYRGGVTLLDATAEAVSEHIDYKLDWADGPMHFDIARPSEAIDIEYESTDLAARAHEDGHPHSLSETDAQPVRPKL